MAIPRTHVVGPLVLPDGSSPTNAELLFELASWDKDSDEVILQGPVSTTCDVNGDFDVQLWASTEGVQSMTYQVTATYYNAVDKRRIQNVLGYIAVPTSGPVFLSDLLVEEATPVTTPEGLALMAAYLADAEAAAVTASAAAVNAALGTPYGFETVAALQADVVMSYTAGVGLEVVVPGQYLIAGVHRYIVVASGATDYDIETAGGVKVQVVRPAGDTWDFMAFGPAINDIAGCADTYETAVNRVDAEGGGWLFMPSNVYYFERTTFTPVSVRPKGASPKDVTGTDAAPVDDQGTIIKPITGGTYIDDFIMLMNVDPADTSSWVRQFPNISQGLSDITFDASDSLDGKNGILFAGTYNFSDIRCRGIKTLLKKPARYTDSVTIDRIFAVDRADTTSYLVDLPGLGDAFRIHSIASGYTEADEITLGLNLKGCRAGEVTGLINGHHLFNQCSGVRVSSAHIEKGSITSQDSNIHIDSCYSLRTDTGGGQIFIKADPTFGSRTHTTVTDCVFQPYSFWQNGTVLQTDSGDIIFEDNGAGRIQGCVRVHTLQGSLDKTAVFGCKIDVENGGGMDNIYNHFSAYLSTQSVFVNTRGPVIEHLIPAHGGTFGGLSAAGIEGITGGVPDFPPGPGTYYYQAVLLIDPTRLLGRPPSGSEVSVTTTLSTEIPNVTLNLSLMDRRSMFHLRLYRGTSSGSYDKYADVHMLSASKLIDDGISIGGQPWITRAAGPVDSVNGGGFSGKIHLSGDKITLDATGTVPTLGTWTDGDKIEKINPTTPGTFNKTLYRLTSGAGWVDGTDYVRAQDTIV